TEFLVPIEKIVGVRHERRALAAESDIGGAKIADGGDPGASGDNGWLADLQRRNCGTSEIGRGLALMKNGLSVAANERDALWRDAKLAACSESGFGENFSQTKIQLAKFASGDGALFGDAKNFF